jgi:UDP-N-acetylmuramate dehydrogenase
LTVDGLARELRAALEGRVETDRPLAPLTTYRVGGPARLYVEPGSVADLDALARVLARAGDDVAVLALGRGSNVVVSDRGWPGIVVRLGPRFSWIESAPHGLRTGAATPLPALANWTARRGLAGLEFTIAIPGSVGGAVRMNAGAHGGAIAHHLLSARVFDLRARAVAERPAAELGLAYRVSNVVDGDVVLDATFALEEVDRPAVRARIERFRAHRARTQPGALQNAGSVFKNPPGDHAGRLVDAAGLKGKRVGAVVVASLHANFFLARDGATAQDVFDLVRAVRDRVRAACGVELEPEIRFAGAFEATGRALEPAAT